MRMMSRFLALSLFGSATFWACGVDHAPDRTAETTGHLYGFEDGPGSGSNPGSGSDPGPGSDPAPDDDTCSAEAAGDDDNAKAKAALEAYLGGCTGQAAIDKVLKDFDKNKDGKLNKDEVLDMVKKIKINGGFFPGTVCGRVMTAIDSNKDGQLSQQELMDFLKKIGLDAPPPGGGSGACAVSEDTAPTPVEAP